MRVKIMDIQTALELSGLTDKELREAISKTIASHFTKNQTSIEPSTQQDTMYFYEWLELVRAGQIKPTIKPSVRWISSREIVKGIKEIEALAYEWLERARVAGVIIHNPDRGTGKPLYVLT
jgi:hypothetical protein